MKDLTLKDKLLWDLSHALFVNDQCQSVNDVQKALKKEYTTEETIAFNKLMFSISLESRMRGIDTGELIADMYVELVTRSLR